MCIFESNVNGTGRCAASEHGVATLSQPCCLRIACLQVIRYDLDVAVPPVGAQVPRRMHLDRVMGGEESKVVQPQNYAPQSCQSRSFPHAGIFIVKFLQYPSQEKILIS